MEKDDFISNLDKRSKSELNSGRAAILECANCGKFVYYGGMNLISLSILNNKPVCSFECNKKLRQC